MSEIQFVVVEYADSQTPIEVHETKKYWQALEWKALNYIDEEAEKLNVDIARKLPNGTLVF